MKYPSETFCALPWMHLSTRPNGHMRVCCTANASGVAVNKESTNKSVSEAGVLRRDDGKPANLATTGLMDSWNNEYMKGVRRMMLNGEKPQSCMKCFKEEDAGHRSKRMWETNKWIKEIGLEDIIADTKEDGSVPARIRYIDLRLGSKCQLACVMCSPHDSSTWVKEYREIWPTLENKNLKHNMMWEKDSGKLAWAGGAYNWHKKNDTFWEELNSQLPYLKQLYWAGGEALIMDEHYDFLEEIIDRGYASQIELRYNSNGLEWRNDLFDLWSHFRRVIFHFSIDDIEKRLEFVRYPSDWNVVQRRIHDLDSYPHSNLTLTTAWTGMAVNLFYLPEFIKWKMTSGFKNLNKYPAGAGVFSCHLAYWPPQLNVKVLPDFMKKQVKEKIYDDLIPWMETNWELICGEADYQTWRSDPYGIKRIEGLVSFMNAEDWSNRLPETAEWCYKVAEHRGIDFGEVYPEYEWLEMYL
jgi:hypothetical protein